MTPAQVPGERRGRCSLCLRLLPLRLGGSTATFWPQPHAGWTVGAGTEDPLWKKLVDGRQTGRRLRHQVRPLEAVPSRPSLGRFVEPGVGWQGDGRLRVKMFACVWGAWGPPGRSLPWKTRGVSRQKDAAGLAPATTPPPALLGAKVSEMCV